MSNFKKIFRKLRYLSGVLSILSISISSYSQKSDKTFSPYFLVKSDDNNTEQMPLKWTNVDVEVSGVIAKVHVSQVYKNEGKNTIEAIYVFPASTKSAVFKMDMRIGERILSAQIYEKNKARKKYEKAKKKGKTASLLEQHKPNVFQMNVANIMPGDTITTDLYYTEILTHESGIYEFVYPTVVGPRYSNKKISETAAEENWVSNPYTKEKVKPNYTFDISVNINAGMAINQVKCETHNTDVKFKTRNELTCKLIKSDKYEGNRDFILNYSISGEENKSGLLLHKGEKENFFLLIMQPPKRPKIEQITGREYIFIVDVSGSMNGFPLDISKKLLKDLIGNLRETDYFNVILFAGTFYQMSEKSIPATQKNINKAINVINNSRGSGGTELLPALKRALSIKKAEGYSRSFIIATDGYVTVEQEAFELIRKSLSEANFFSFGIGSSVNRYIIDGIAHAGNGEAFVITNQNEAILKADKFRKYIQSPVLTDIKVSYKGFEVYDIEPLSVPDVFAEKPVLIFGKWKGNSKGEITITGNSGNKKFIKSFKLNSDIISCDNEAIKYLWARKKLQILDDYASLPYTSSKKQEIIDLGLKYNLLTKYTSFVAIDSLARKTGNTSTVKQPIPLPEGVSNNAVTSTKTVNNYGTGSIQKRTEIIHVVENNNTIEQDFEFDIEDDEETEIEIVEIEEVEECEDNVVFLIVEKNPEYPGGIFAIRKFIAENLKYPEAARENGIQGTVYLRFQIKADGTLGKIEIQRGVDPLLDKEAVRIIKLMVKNKKFSPGMQGGKKVSVWFSLPITFELK